jgi:peptidoglycan/LPS O-acetylase OafA/YrhL
LSRAAWTCIEVLAVFAIAVMLVPLPIGPSPVVEAVLGRLGWPWLFSARNAPFAALVILCFAYQGGLVSRLLGWRLLVFPGEISFTTYMIHHLIMRFWILEGWTAWTSPWNPIGLALILLTIYVASYLIWRFFERPMRRLLLASGKLRLWGGGSRQDNRAGRQGRLALGHAGQNGSRYRGR